jgi:aspartyl-tRNA(Asn)/glutamyl-tRNA(Gln) amidotransferase subunit A
MDAAESTTSTPRIGDLARLSATAMLAGYAAGRFTPDDVIEQVIDALVQTDSVCNVMVTPMFDSAREAARAATLAYRKGSVQGSLTGVPVTVKDLIYVAGVPAAGGSPLAQGFVPEADAYAVTRLREAGAVLTCKTTTCESGYKLTADSPVSGITRNPWHTSHTSGGSSGGAAAAVAAGCGPLALGTDGVGSIRVPAAFCGVVGLKPTFGLVARAPGFFPPSWATLAHTGPIGRTVGDVALLLEAIAGYDSRDAASLPLPPRRFDVSGKDLKGVRIGYSEDLGYAPVTPDVRAAFRLALDKLVELGAELVPAKLVLDPEVLERIAKPIAYTEQSAAVLARTPGELSRSDAEYRDIVDQARNYRGVDYVDAMHRRTKLRGQFFELFREVALLATPSVAVTAFAAGSLGVDRIDGTAVDPHLGWSPFSWPINLAGLPAATIPCGFDRNDLPIGLQLVGPWLEEPLVLRVAAAFERVAPWASRWPSFTPA